MKKGNWAIEFFTKLSNLYEDEADVLEIIEDTINSYGDYVNYVYKMESKKVIFRLKLEPLEYREVVQKMDSNRTNIHNAAIASTKIINRLCEPKKLELFYQGDIDDRVEVAEFIKEVVLNIFENRKL